MIVSTIADINSGLTGVDVNSYLSSPKGKLKSRRERQLTSAKMSSLNRNARYNNAKDTAQSGAVPRRF
ncbi:hypothetical protein [Bradyrhizobium cosmicum]|uniref:hypothetical protein n=1 Tax=Bradyrhizobium cosmicum TaxID=1404864 RepID=UPI0028F09DC6|nr:hypothetical protein [Bradyrhizobium cosmicum]